MDHLWLGSVLALSVLFISVLPLPPNDLWWHMAAGRTMVAEHAWLRTNRWAFTLPYDAPYVYQSWLSEVLLYGVWRLGDVPLLALLRTAAIASSYGLVAWHALRRAANGKAAAVALALAVLIGWNNWTLRPQTLALVPGAAFIVVLDCCLSRRANARWLMLLPALMVVWVNLHGSFILGLALMALACVGRTLSALRSPAALRREALLRLRWLWLAGVVVLAATMVHPLGIGVFGYVRDLLTDAPSQNRIAEWQPPTNAINLTNTGFWFYVVVLAVPALLTLGRRRPSATDLLWFLCLAWLTIGGVRYAMWFALALMPFLAEQIAGLGKARPALRTSPRFAIALMALFGILSVAVLPWFGPGRYLGPEAAHLFAAEGPHHELLGGMTPLAATGWLKEHPIAGRFWVEMSYSSYTIWALPDKQVFSDLRVDLFPDTIWDDYFAIAGGDARSVDLLDRWKITHLMLDLDGQANLRRRLAAMPGWCEVYKDSRTAIVARCR